MKPRYSGANGAGLLPDQEKCLHCRRHDAREQQNAEVVVDCMISIARAAAMEKATGDSRCIERARGAAIEKLKVQLR